jgi:hypothetical protein
VGVRGGVNGWFNGQMAKRQRTFRLSNQVRFPSILLMAGVCAACAGTNYQSPAPTRDEVKDVQAQVESASPERQPLTWAQADALARPIFNSISEDAARICRTVSEADSCLVPEFEVVDLDHVNSRALYDMQNDPNISLTRGLVEQLADQKDELALVIGHEYGHLITAHVEDGKQDGGDAGNALGSMLSVLAAASLAVVSDGNVRYQPITGPSYSQREIDEYMRTSADPHGVYKWFSKAEELEADYIGTYLATRGGYSPTGSAFIEIGALDLRDQVSSLEKQDLNIKYEYWDTHPYNAERAAHIQETLEEIETLKSMGYARPIPPRLIQDITDNNAAFHSLEELVGPFSGIQPVDCTDPSTTTC